MKGLKGKDKTEEISVAEEFDPSKELVIDEEEVDKIIFSGTYEEWAGNFYYKVLKEHPPLTREETTELFVRYKQLRDETAREELILYNLRYVVFLARRYHNSHLDFWDLVQYGTLGLFKAIEKFEHEKGYALSTYATWWIRQVISREIANTFGQVRLPIHISAQRSKVYKAQKELLSELKGQKPTPFEISERSGIEETRVRSFLSGMGSMAFSFDEKIDEDSKRTHAEVTGDRKAISQSMILMAKEKQKEFYDKIIVLFTILHSERPNISRQIEMFKDRYFSGSIDIRLTLEMVAIKYSITRERVRQIIEGVWQHIGKYYPRIDLNDAKFDDMLKRLRTMEDATGFRMSIQELEEEASKRRPSSFSINISLSDRHRLVTHSYVKTGLIRISPNFFMWKKNGCDRTLAEHALDCVSFCYEVNPEQVIDSHIRPTKDISWSREVLIHLMMNRLGFKSPDVMLFFKILDDSFLDYHIKKFKKILAQSKVVSDEVRGLVSHFCKEMKC